MSEHLRLPKPQHCLRLPAVQQAGLGNCDDAGRQEMLGAAAVPTPLQVQGVLSWSAANGTNGGAPNGE